MEKLQLKFKGKSSKTISDLVTRFLIKQQATYNANTGEKQCSGGRMRSLQDLTACMRHYFPDLAISAMVWNTLKRPENRVIYVSHCPTVRRNVASPMNYSMTVEEVREMLKNALKSHKNYKKISKYL